MELHLQLPTLFHYFYFNISVAVNQMAQTDFTLPHQKMIFLRISTMFIVQLLNMFHPMPILYNESFFYEMYEIYFDLNKKQGM
jgi:hypothetical protein